MLGNLEFFQLKAAATMRVALFISAVFLVNCQGMEPLSGYNPLESVKDENVPADQDPGDKTREEEELPGDTLPQPEEDPGEPKEDPGEPKEDPGEPKEDPGEPKEDPGEPKEDPGEPKEDPGEPKEDPGEPKEDPGEPEEMPEDSDLAPLPVRPGASTFYVDCQGNDSSSGQSPTQAWRNLTRLSNLSLNPGDRILLKRGCTWRGPLRVTWSGSADWPVVIGAYGEGELPGIRDSSSNHVDIFGSYVVVENLRAFTSPGAVPVDPGCDNQPYGWRTGFTIQGGARYVTIRHSLAYGNTAGVHITRTASHNRVIYNELRDNILMSVNTNDGGHDDSGAWGLVLNGTDNEIAHNRFSGNNAWCSYDFGQEGASIEVYEAARNYIHHNISINDTTFTELGSSSFRQAADNVYAYNVYSSNLPSEFLVTRGPNSPFGPVSGTKVFNNTVHLTHPERTQGVVCYGGCSPQMLELRNNILWVQWKTIFADAPFAESNNIYWRADGRPLMQFFGGSQMSATSKVANPRFVDAPRHNLKLQQSSPAIDAGVTTSLGITKDVEGVPVPQNGTVDIGAHEYKR